MNVFWAAIAWDQYLEWQREQPAIAIKINSLVESTRRTSFSGLGRPEPLRRNLSGLWSRRITAEHRLVYRVTGSGEAQQISIVQCRFHY